MKDSEMETIINNVKTNWSKDHTIRYLYIKLAPFFQRDLKYFLATEEEKFKEYSQGFINRGRNIVCSTLADYYVELFQIFGIRAKKIAANSAKIPLFTVIVEGDHGWFFIDPLTDLFNNQYGLKTTEFGAIPHYKTLEKNYPFLEKLPKEYIDKIDEDLELPKTLDDYFRNLHLEMTNKHLIRKRFKTENEIEIFRNKIEFSNQELINLGKVNDPFERIKLYLFLERVLFFKKEKRNLKIWLNNDYEIPRAQLEYTNFNTGNSALYQEIKEDNQYVLKRRK